MPLPICLAHPIRYYLDRQEQAVTLVPTWLPWLCYGRGQGYESVQ